MRLGFVRHVDDDGEQEVARRGGESRPPIDFELRIADCEWCVRAEFCEPGPGRRHRRRLWLLVIRSSQFAMPKQAACERIDRESADETPCGGVSAGHYVKAAERLRMFEIVSLIA